MQSMFSDTRRDIILTLLFPVNPWVRHILTRCVYWGEEAIILKFFEVTPLLLYQQTQHLVNIKFLRLCPQGVNTGVDWGGASEKRAEGDTEARAEARPVSIAASEAAGEEVFHFLSCGCPLSV